MRNSVSQLNSIVHFNIKPQPDLNQYIKFLKHKLCIAQITYKSAVLYLFMRFNRFQRHQQNVKSILKVKIYFYLHRAYAVYQQSAHLIQQAAFLDD